MIQPRSMLDVADNSGAKRVQCIRVMGGSNKRYASLGDTVIVAVKEAAPDGTVKQGEVARAVVVRTGKEVGRQDGATVRVDRRAGGAGSIEREGALHLSNVLLVCGRCDRPVRIGIKVLADDRKVRICKRCGEPIDKG